MCIFTRFRHLCLHEKFKIARACNKASLDCNGVLTCPDDPNPQLDDGKNHVCGPRTYGIGVCASIHCAWHHSILPLGDYGDDKRFGGSTSFEDDTEIIESPEAREDRVARWYRLLNADQQLDHYQTEYPLPYDQRSFAGRALLEFPYGAAVTPLDSLQWQELNPKLLSPAMLQWCVFHQVLPASVVDGRKSDTISPLQPIAGLLKLTGAHKCPEKHGICKKCGANIGDRTLKEKTLAYRQAVAFQTSTDEDSAEQDLKGSVWDSSVDLKWNDEKGAFVKVLTNQGQNIQTHDEPHRVSNSSDAAFAPPTAQPVEDNCSAFYEQDTAPLANDGLANSMELGFPDGMDWQDFTEASTSSPLVHPLEATSGSLYWPYQDPPTGIAEAFSSSPDEHLRDPFLFDPSTSFTEDAAATAEHIDFAHLGSHAGGRLFSNSDGDLAMDMDEGEDEDYNNQDETSSEYALDPTSPSPTRSPINNNNNPIPQQRSSPSFNPDSSPQGIPGPISSSATSTFPPVSYEKQVESFILEQQIANDTTYQPPPETVRVVVQMVRQAEIGGVARPSYDGEANQIFEMMMQHAIAGLL
jgi:hypothetical protein